MLECLTRCHNSKFNPFQSSIAFNIETSYLICFPKHDWIPYEMKHGAKVGKEMECKFF